jgi:hypothetical protein
MRRTFIVFPLIVALALQAGLATAAIDQLDARDDPSVAGALELRKTQCQRREKSFGGELAAVAKACMRFYTLDPAAENDAARDFGAVWLQSNLDPKNGWCATAVFSDILLPEGANVHAKAPRGTIEIGRRKTRTTRLVIDAQGEADQNASLSQSAIVFPRKITGSMRDQGTIFRTRWAGARARKLAFPSGVELSWNAENPPGELAISFLLNYELRKGC